MRTTDRDRIRLIATFVAAIAILATLRFVNPGDVPWFPSCPFHATTGLHCPGCGSLRALHHLLHFRLYSAISSNPLMVLCLPFLTVVVLRQLGRRQELPSSSHPMWGWFCFWVIMLFWITRNIPTPPFCWLAPDEAQQANAACHDLVTVVESTCGATA